MTSSVAKIAFVVTEVTFKVAVIIKITFVVADITFEVAVITYSVTKITLQWLR